jgi:pyruvate/2-oxoglutarate dehydrogenase complex dihydrolipoamide dehydrogenase (E3) component
MGQGAGDEIEFYFAQAGRGTSTLELACGAGRLTVSLAEWGNRHQHGDWGERGYGYTHGMAKYDYDIIILGGGSAGIVSGVMAGALGMRVLLIEKGKMGGECLNTGCVPSKALIHAARVAHTLRTAGECGLKSVGVSREDAAGVMAHVRATIKAVEGADATVKLLEDNGVEIRHGAARFTNPHTLEMGGGTLTAANFILATGSSPAPLDVPGLAEAGYLANQTVFDLDAIPESLLVVGGGPNGVEMAQAFRRLGSHVTLVQNRERLLPRDDVALSSALAGILRREGIDIRFDAKVTSVRVEDGRRVATVTQGDGDREVICDEILSTVGRVPNTDGLNLEAAGVAFDGGRVQTDAALRTTTSHIYAGGDLLGHDQFSHLAEYEAKLIVRNIVFPGTTRTDFHIDPWATFTDPEVAHLGLTEEEAKERGLAYEVYTQPFAQNDRAIVEGDAQGFVKILSSGLGGNILGVHILGPHAGELMHEWILAMQHGHSIRDVADLVHIYPTLSMASQHAAQRWYERKGQEPWAKAALGAYVNGIRPHQTTLVLGLAGAATAGLGLTWARRGNSRRDG